MKYFAVIGGTGAIGSEFVKQLSQTKSHHVFVFSRTLQHFVQENVTSFEVDFNNDATFSELVFDLPALSGVLVATGLLYDEAVQPEKSLKEVTQEKMAYVFEANTILPAIVLKHFLPKLSKSDPSYCGVLSARVGSISDNRLGGWYSYRASKAALNMLIKTASIELARMNKQATVIGLHPGTVQSQLSQPFSSRVPEDKYFTPGYSVACLLSVLANIRPDQSGQCLAYDGSIILP